MDINPELYEKINNVAIYFAKKTIGEYLENNKNANELDTIIDIGCGPGNITKLLSKSIKHNKLYAFDIEASLIDYANLNNKSHSITYAVQDISLPWKDLGESIKKLEGTADFIFSNFALHWVENKQNAAENVFKLLKSGGICCMNIVYNKDIVRAMPEDLLFPYFEEFPIFKIQVSKERQLGMWISYFKLLGVQNIKGNIELYNWQCDNESDMKKRLDFFWKFYTKSYSYNYSYLMCKGEEYLEKLRRYIDCAVLAKLNELPKNYINIDQRQIESALLQIKIQAP